MPVGAYGSCVSAKSQNVDAAKAFVKWLWVDQTDKQLDWAQSYGFHIPARKSLAAKADKLKSGPAADAARFVNENGHAQSPLLWSPKTATAFSDGLTRIVRSGADPKAADRRDQGGRRRRAQARRRLTRPRAEDERHHRGSGDGDPRPATPGGPCPGGCAAPQDRNLWFWVFVGPFVLGLLVFVYLPDRVEPAAELLRRAQHRHPDEFVGLGNYADMLSDAAFRSSLLTFVVFAAFIVPDHVRAVPRAGAAGQPRPVRPDVLPVGVLPADRVLLRRGVAGLEDVDLLRGAVRPGQHGARLVRHRARRRGSR